MLDRLSLTKRINLGFAFVIGVVVLLAIVVTFVTWRLAVSVERYQTTANQTIVLNEYLEDLLEARLAALAYREDDSAQNAAAVASNLAEITQSTAGQQAFADFPDLLQDIGALQAAATEYDATFRRTVELQAQRHEEVAAIAALGQEARVTLSQVHSGVVANGMGPSAIEAAGSVVESLLLSRLYAERFLLTNDETALAESKDHLETLRRNGRILTVALTGRDTLLGQTEDALRKMGEFESALDRVSDIVLERNRLRGEVMDTIGATVTSRIDSALDQVLELQAEAGLAAGTLLSRTQIFLPLATVLCVIASILIAYLIGRSATSAIEALGTSTRRLADGDVDVAIEGTEHDHELGQMARALVVFKENEIERRSVQAAAEESHRQQQRVVASVSSSLEGLADGDLTVRLEGDFPPEFADLKTNFNRTMERLNETISQVVETANWISDNAQVLGDATDQLSRRNENQAAAIEETSAASTTLSGSVKETSSRAMQARTFAGTTRERAARGAKTVEDTTLAMDRIQESSEKIAAIIGLIEDVAFQTNLLALNAGVEAARAGEAGRGFAVVASEVGALSQRSAEAVSEIRGIIAQAAEDVTSGVEAVKQAGGSIREIGEMVDQISTLIEEISDGASEQSDSLLSTNESVKQIDTMTQENAAMSEETAATAKGLADGAKSLLDVTAQFKTASDATATNQALVA
jgi:methyl-accepting chemotaxis protein